MNEANHLHDDLLHAMLPLIPKSAVQPLDMVDKSTSPFQTNFGPVFRDEAVQRDLLFPEPGSIRVFLRAPSPISP